LSRHNPPQIPIAAPSELTVARCALAELSGHDPTDRERESTIFYIRLRTGFALQTARAVLAMYSWTRN
jgi:hypothetical protein